MDNNDNIIPFDREGDDRKRIAVIETRLEKNEANWTDDSINLAVTYAEIRDRHPSDNAFGAWLQLNDLGRRYNAHDQAALICMGRRPDIMREVLEEAASRSYQLIWRKYKDRFANASIPAPKPTLQPEVVAAPPVAMLVSEPAVTKTEVQTPVEPAKPVETYEVPKISKLRDMVGEAADVLHANFKHSRIFIAAFRNEKANTARLFGNYIAKRCQQSDYPQALFSAQTWSLEMVYPHLPKRLVGQLPQVLGTLKNEHSMLAELERLFMATPEFGVVDPPLAAFNKAMSIYNSLKHRKAGGTIDPNAVHKPVYGDDDGKPPIIVRGTKLWPAENTSGYRYDDLRCACGFADDILKAFLEPSDVPISTKALKLRHVRSWLTGGYNSTGSTFEGTLKAFEAVIHAYTQNVSEEMRNPLPSIIKLDGDTR